MLNFFLLSNFEPIIPKVVLMAVEKRKALLILEENFGLENFSNHGSNSLWEVPIYQIL